MKRFISLLNVILALSLLVAGCAAPPPAPTPTPSPAPKLTPTPVRPTATPVPSPIPTSPRPTSTPVPPTPTPIPPTPTAPAPTPTLPPTPTAEVPGAKYGSEIVKLMRAANARELAVGRQQSNWGLEGIPDGGRDFPSLDALDNVSDLTPHVGNLQMAIFNLSGGAPGYVFWNHETGAPYSSFEELYGHDWWQSNAEEGNLEEMREVLEKMRIVGIFGLGIDTLVKLATRDSVDRPYYTSPPEERANWDLVYLQDAMRRAVPGTVLVCQEGCPDGQCQYVSQYLDNVYPAAQLTRAYLSFDTSRLANAPAIVDPVRLQIKHLFIIAQTDWWEDDPTASVRAATVGIGLSSGWWDPNTKSGTGWGLGASVWVSSPEERVKGWDSCPEGADSISVDTVGRQEGLDMLAFDSSHIYTEGWTQFRIALGDETDLADPGMGNETWRLYELSGHIRDHWLIIELAFPPLPPMPTSFQ
jgi:hypothetical protein